VAQVAQPKSQIEKKLTEIANLVGSALYTSCLNVILTGKFLLIKYLLNKYLVIIIIHKQIFPEKIILLRA
jgi:hypothetical protein